MKSRTYPKLKLIRVATFLHIIQSLCQWVLILVKLKSSRFMSDSSIENGYRSTWPEDISFNIHLGFCLQGTLCLTLRIYGLFFYLTILASYLHPENTSVILEQQDYFQFFHCFTTILGWQKYFANLLPTKLKLSIWWHIYLSSFVLDDQFKSTSFAFDKWYYGIESVSTRSTSHQYHQTIRIPYSVQILAGVTIIALAIWGHKKALDVSVPLSAAKVLRKATQQHAYIEYARTRSPLQFTTATMAWSVNPVQSLILIHNENLATSYVDGRTPTFQPILPAAVANTIRHPRHLLTMLGLSSENDPSKPPPDTSISVRSSFEKIRLRVRPPFCQLGQTMKCCPKPSTPLWWW